VETEMKWQHYFVESYQNMFRELEKVLDGLTGTDLPRRPAPGANPIGWLCWHTVRSCDRFLGDVALGQQLWITEGWHAKFSRPPDSNETGSGFTGDQVDALRIPDVTTLLNYERAVAGALAEYLGQLTEDELEREAPNSQSPGSTRPVHARLLGILNNYQHVGQAGYVRGIIKGQGWYGR
jgi:hypothetical protein